MTSSPIKFRTACALIKHYVRERLGNDSRIDIWQTDYFISQIGLGSVAYDYLHAELPNGAVAPVDSLIAVVVEEFRDYVLVRDLTHKVQSAPVLRCSKCDSNILFAKLCANCGHPVFFQSIEADLESIIASLALASSDPIGRRMIASTERVRLENAYAKSVTCFEVLHRDLNEFAFVKRGEGVKSPGSKNHFQNIDKTTQWFENHHKYQISSTVMAQQLVELRKVFQKRHVLAHSGLIDKDYCDTTKEDTQLIGQPVQLDKSEVIEAVQILKQIVTAAHVHFAP